MAKHFPLDHVLSYRLQIEERLRVAYALEQMRLENTQNQEKLAEQKLLNAQVKLNTLKSAETIDIPAIVASQYEIERIRREIVEKQHLVQQAQSSADIAHGESIKASQKRLAMERLKSMFTLNARVEEERAENNRLTEMGLITWSRRSHPNL